MPDSYDEATLAYVLSSSLILPAACSFLIFGSSRSLSCGDLCEARNDQINAFTIRLSRRLICDQFGDFANGDGLSLVTVKRISISLT